MRIVIAGGGIAAVYLANHIKTLAAQHDVLIVSDEPYAPYDRIHLCALVDRSKTLEEISLPSTRPYNLNWNKESNRSIQSVNSSLLKTVCTVTTN